MTLPSSDSPLECGHSTHSVIQLVFAVQRLQVGEVLLEDVDVGLQERLAERLD